MRSITTPQFWKCYDSLPKDVQRRADRAYELWQIDPQAQGLYFKRVGTKRPVYSVRIDRGYRALGILDDDAIVWFWIGQHDVYIRLLRNL
jgi:hypothetical protein